MSINFSLSLGRYDVYRCGYESVGWCRFGKRIRSNELHAHLSSSTPILRYVRTMSVCVFQDNKSLVLLTNTLYMHYLHKTIGALYCEKWETIAGGGANFECQSKTVNVRASSVPSSQFLYFLYFQCDAQGVIQIDSTDTDEKSLTTAVAVMIQMHKNFIRRHGKKGNSRSNTRCAKVSGWIEEAVMKIAEPKVNTTPGGYLHQLNDAEVIESDFIEEFSILAYIHYCRGVSVPYNE